jgi:hypothetical protein
VREDLQSLADYVSGARLTVRVPLTVRDDELGQEQSDKENWINLAGGNVGYTEQIPKTELVGARNAMLLSA